VEVTDIAGERMAPSLGLDVATAGLHNTSLTATTEGENGELLAVLVHIM